MKDLQSILFKSQHIDFISSILEGKIELKYNLNTPSLILKWSESRQCQVPASDDYSDLDLENNAHKFE